MPADRDQREIHARPEQHGEAQRRKMRARVSASHARKRSVAVHAFGVICGAARPMAAATAFRATTSTVIVRHVRRADEGDVMQVGLATAALFQQCPAADPTNSEMTSSGAVSARYTPS